jgi:hypothetical protein
MADSNIPKKKRSAKIWEKFLAAADSSALHNNERIAFVKKRHHLHWTLTCGTRVVKMVYVYLQFEHLQTQSSWSVRLVRQSIAGGCEVEEWHPNE